MLHIRPHQLASLQEQKQRRFEERLCAHGRRHFPERCGSLGDEVLRKAVRDVIRIAREAGITSELGIALYFNVAVRFGMQFPRNREIRWAFPIERHPEESVDPGWILRVSEIAVQTLRSRQA